MHRNSTIVSTKRERIATLARQSPQMAFTSLAYLMDMDRMREAHRRTRKDGAAGVDGVTADEYERDLEGNLRRLLDRAKSGTYQGRPDLRGHRGVRARPMARRTDDRTERTNVSTEPALP